MKVSYYLETDSLYIKLKEGVELEGEEVESGIVLHYGPGGEVVSIEMDSSASTLADVGVLEASGIESVIARQVPAKKAV